MSATKFASITAGLLARKGEARPWTDPGKKSLSWQDQPALMPPPIEEFEALEPPPVLFTPPPAPQPLKAVPQPKPPVAKPVAKGAAPRKCAVRMSSEEYEMLGIMAVKKDCTRQQLLRDAVAQLLSSMADEYRSQCGCLQSCGTAAWPSADH